jgi:hypothetical protein
VTELQIYNAEEEEWVTVTTDNTASLFPFVFNLASSNLVTIFTEIEHVELAVMQQYLVGEASFVI